MIGLYPFKGFYLHLKGVVNPLNGLSNIPHIPKNMPFPFGYWFTIDEYQ